MNLIMFKHENTKKIRTKPPNSMHDHTQPMSLVVIRHSCHTSHSFKLNSSVSIVIKSHTALSKLTNTYNRHMTYIRMV